MVRRLILDTGLMISAERSGSSLANLLEDEDDVVLAAVSAAELIAGVELASPSRREARATFVSLVLDQIPVEPYDLSVAEHHGVLLAHVHRAGEPRGAHDLLIAATARATGRTILTGDRAARFGELPGVEAIVA